MMQFINGLAVTKRTADKHLDDAVAALVVNIKTIKVLRSISHHELAKMMGYAFDKDEVVCRHWTAIDICVGSGKTYMIFFRHKLEDVTRAIAFTQAHPSRTVIMVDDVHEEQYDHGK